LRLSRLFLLVPLAAIALAGCDALTKSKKEPLPGERISVLALEKRLEPDPDLAKLEIALPHPAPLADWPQAGGNPSHEIGHPALPDGLKQAWKVNVGDGSSRFGEVLGGPVVVGDTAYVMDARRQVTAVAIATGKRLWEADVGPADDDGQAWGGGIGYDAGRIYVTTGWGQVLALNAKDGKEIWRVSTGTPLRGAPTIADGRIFTINVDNSLIALSTADGHRLWSFDGIPESAELAGSASPAVEGGVVVAPFTSGEIVALRVENGRQVWTDSLAATRRFDAISTLADIRGRPVISKGRVFAVSHSGRMASIDLRTGDRAWEQEIGGTSSPWVAGDFVYVMSTSAELICLTRADGRIRWITQLDRWEDPEDKSGNIAWAGPILAGDRLVMLASNGWAWSYSPYTGKPLSRVELPAGSYMAPVVANDTLYLMTADAELMAFR
jgi:outer membrane protein assembly factor BamB